MSHKAYYRPHECDNPNCDIFVCYARNGTALASVRTEELAIIVTALIETYTAGGALTVTCLIEGENAEVTVTYLNQEPATNAPH